MREDLELKLQEDFPFMKQNKVDVERNIYRRWGCECSRGWYQLIHDLCQAITDRYAEDKVPVDIVIEQIKEKFASLRFYYSFEGAPCGLQAIDSLGGPSLRFEPYNIHDDDTKKKLRYDISQIVRSYEEKSKSICEICGKEGTMRMTCLGNALCAMSAMGII